MKYYEWKWKYDQQVNDSGRNSARYCPYGGNKTAQIKNTQWNSLQAHSLARIIRHQTSMYNSVTATCHGSNGLHGLFVFTNQTFLVITLDRRRRATSAARFYVLRIAERSNDFAAVSLQRGAITSTCLLLCSARGHNHSDGGRRRPGIDSAPISLNTSDALPEHGTFSGLIVCLFVSNGGGRKPGKKSGGLGSDDFRVAIKPERSSSVGGRDELRKSVHYFDVVVNFNT